MQHNDSKRLIAKGFSPVYDGRVLDTWKKRLGAILLIVREQERHEDRSNAAKQAGIDPKTVQRIERGYPGRDDLLERYAQSLGLEMDDLTAAAKALTPLEEPPAKHA